MWWEFADILAKTGKITLNSATNPNSTGPCGMTMGPRGNGSSALRLGAWAINGTGTSGGAAITTPSGLAANMSTSSSDIEINTDYFYNWEGGYGINFNTTGSVSIKPSVFSGGLVAAAANYKAAQNSTNYQMGRLYFGVSPASFTFNRSTTTTDINLASAVTAAGPITVFGGAIGGTENYTKPGAIQRPVCCF